MSKSVFPKDYIYLDFNSSGRVLPEVLEMTNDFLIHPLNPSSTHYLGQIASGLIEDTRDFLKDYFNCSNHNCLFLGSGSEANNLAINYIDQEFDLYICSGGDHKSVYQTISNKKNHIVASIDKNSLIDSENLIDIIQKNKEKRIFLSIIYANNETGAINDLKNLIKEIRLVHNEVIIHSDIAQAIGKIKIDINDLDLDLATIIGYKFGGLIGSAALIYRKNIKLKSMIYGGSQESNLRAGTENAVSIYSMRVALENQPDYFKIKELRDNFEKELKIICNCDDLRIFAENVDRIQNTSYFSISNLPSKTQLISYSNEKIYLGVGSACSAGLDEDSHVLIEMGCNHEERKNAIRMSLGWNNTQEEIHIFVQKLKQLYNKFKQIN
jgi:cysteine desulfurase